MPASFDPAAADVRHDLPPFWLPVLAGLPLALGLGLVLLGVVLLLNAVISMLRAWRERVDGLASAPARAWGAA